MHFNKIQVTRLSDQLDDKCKDNFNSREATTFEFDFNGNYTYTKLTICLNSQQEFSHLMV